MAKKEKKLTEKEQKRLEIYEEKAKALEEQGYTKKLMMVSPLMANLGSLLVTVPFVVLYVWAFLAICGKEPFSFIRDFTPIFLFLLCYIVLIVLHELIHGFTWKTFLKDKSVIEFGFNAAAFAPYCACTAPLTKSQYIWGALMPTLWLGFLLGAVSIYASNAFLLVLSCGMMIGGGGDFLMIINLLKNKVSTKDVLYYDHPTEIGSVMFYR